MTLQTLAACGGIRGVDDTSSFSYEMRILKSTFLQKCNLTTRYNTIFVMCWNYLFKIQPCRIGDSEVYIHLVLGQSVYCKNLNLVNILYKTKYKPFTNIWYVYSFWQYQTFFYLIVTLVLCFGLHLKYFGLVEILLKW
jgi:hypothetical protein